MRLLAVFSLAMDATEAQTASSWTRGTHESVQRENRLRHRRERERARHASENPEQREERFSGKRRIRDRTWRTAQTAERREADLQQRRRRLAGETDEVRQARL